MAEQHAAGEGYKVPDIGKREAAMNLVLTEAMHLLQGCREVIQPWYGPSAGDTQARISELLPRIKSAMALDFDRFRPAKRSDFEFDQEKAERDRATHPSSEGESR